MRNLRRDRATEFSTALFCRSHPAPAGFFSGEAPPDRECEEIEQFSPDGGMLVIRGSVLNRSTGGRSPETAQDGVCGDLQRQPPGNTGRGKVSCHAWRVTTPVPPPSRVANGQTEVATSGVDVNSR